MTFFLSQWFWWERGPGRIWALCWERPVTQTGTPHPSMEAKTHYQKVTIKWILYAQKDSLNIIILSAWDRKWHRNWKMWREPDDSNRAHISPLWTEWPGHLWTDGAKTQLRQWPHHHDGKYTISTPTWKAEVRVICLARNRITAFINDNIIAGL